MRQIHSIKLIKPFFFIATSLIFCVTAFSAVYQVTDPIGDPTVPGSLAYVILQANADTDAEVKIEFAPDLPIIYLNDSLQILRSMTLEGPATGGRPIIAGNNTLQGMVVISAAAGGTKLHRVIVGEFGGTGIYISAGANGVKLQDCQIFNGSGKGMEVYASNVKLTDVKIYNMAGTCVEVHAPGFSYSGGSLTAFTGWGITLEAGAGNAYIANLYMDLMNIIGDAGITLKYGADGNVIENCTIVPVDPYQNNATGLIVESSNNRVYTSTLRGGYEGIRIGLDLGVTWNGRYASSNAFYGCVASGTYGLVLGSGAQNNWVQGYTANHRIDGVALGIVFTDVTTVLNSIVGSTISAGAAPILAGGDASYNTIYANSIQEGTIAGIVLGLQGWGGTHSNTIIGNEIGLVHEGDGYVRGGAQYCGVLMSNGALYNMLQGNVVGGQVTHGFFIYGYDCANNYVQNNYIGLDHPGLPLSSQNRQAELGGYGVFLWDTWYNTIYQNAFGYSVYGSIGNFGNSNFIQ